MHITNPWLTTALLLSLATSTGAFDAAAADPPPWLQSKVFLQISPDGRDDLEGLFDTLEASIAAGEAQSDPVVIVLHGSEAHAFLRSNYLAHRNLIDRAAKLRAFNRIDLRMCETWMRNNGIGRDELLPFVDTVPLAPAEVEKLEKHGYVPFTELIPGSGLL